MILIFDKAIVELYVLDKLIINPATLVVVDILEIVIVSRNNSGKVTPIKWNKAASLPEF